MSVQYEEPLKKFSCQSCGADILMRVGDDGQYRPVDADAAWPRWEKPTCPRCAKDGRNA